MKRQAHPQRRRRGTALILVLGITTLLVTLGIAATQIARGQLERNALEQDQAAARLAAQSTQDLIQKALDGQTTWRSTAVSGDWNTFATLDGVQLYYAYVDEVDGDLGNDTTQPFVLYSLAVSGDSKRCYRVELVPDSANNLRRNEPTFEQVVFGPD